MFERQIKRFFKKLFCSHRIKDRVGYSRRKHKHVYQCYSCGKFLYLKN